MQNKFSPHGGFFVEGTISWGSLRSQDLLKSFTDELERLAPFSYKELRFEAREALEALERGEEPEHSSEIISDLIDALGHIASKHGFYFGTTEGDGSDFGFWPIETSEEACQ